MELSMHIIDQYRKAVYRVMISEKPSTHAPQDPETPAML
jgi:hypothetical protein